MSGYSFKSEIKPILDEITKANREMARLKGTNPAENTNRVISAKGMDYLRKHVEQDTHYASVLDTRICSLLDHGWKILPASSKVNGKTVVEPIDREICDFVEYALSNMTSDFESDIVAMMSMIGRGFSLSEINYRYVDVGRFKGKLGLKNIRFKEQDMFAFEFDDFGNYTLNQIDPEKRKLELNKFVHMINGINDENPYGYSVAATCAFYVWLKENGLKFWAIYQERYGQPFVTLKVPKNIKDDKEQLQAAQDILKAVETQSGILIPEGMVLDYLEATRSGEANYRAFPEFCNNEMSKVVGGGTLQFDTQKNASGSHALGKEHSDIMGKKFSYDIISSSSAINNQIIKRLVDLNYLNVERYPKFIWQQVDYGWFITFAQGVEALLRSGMTIPQSWVYELASIPLPEEGEQVLIWMPGMSAVPPSNAGVDNKVPNSAGKEPIPGQARNDNAGNHEDNTDHFSDEEKIAQELMDGNERVIRDGKTEMAGRWSKFIAKLAEGSYLDMQMLDVFVRTNLAPVYAQVLQIGALRGVESGLYETQPNGYSQTVISRAQFSEYYYKPFDKILQDYKKRGILSKREYDELTEEMKRKAFTIANQESIYVIDKVKKELDEVLQNKATIRNFYDRVIDIFTRAGVIGGANHLETVLRTNLQSQYVDGREKVFAQTSEEQFPYAQILAVMDSATRDKHAALHRYTRPVTDPVWSWLKPPFEFNCRCTKRLVHKSENVTVSEFVPDKGDYEFTR